MTIQVFTRSNNDQLYDLMRSLIPADVECIKVTGYDHWTQAADYLYHIIDTGVEWAVNVDIDCFIYDWGKVLDLIKEMSDDGSTHAGVPDGGLLPGREHSWVHLNPFFNVFNAVKIRQLKEYTLLSWEEISKTQYKPYWDGLREAFPFINGKINNDNEEPFAGFFYWLFHYGEIYFTPCTVHSDGISTIVNKSMIHTWYSREFNHGHAERILARYEEAKIAKELLDSGINLKQLI